MTLLAAGASFAFPTSLLFIDSHLKFTVCCVLCAAAVIVRNHFWFDVAMANSVIAAAAASCSSLFNELVVDKPTTLLDSKMMKSCFDVFDQDGDGMLDLKEFHSLARALFCTESGTPYEMEMSKVQEIFKIFDANKDGKIDSSEFATCWNDWVRKILCPITAVIAVDIQNDFISGSLSLKNCPAAQDGAEVIPVANYLLQTIPFDVVIYSLDWHPADHISFFENLKNRKLHSTSPISAEDAKLLDTVIFEGPPITEQILWPTHCIQDSWGAQLHPELKVVPEAKFIRKGTNPNIDSYSVFWDNNKLSQTSLLKELQDHNVTDVYICGLAYDVCVGATTMHSLEHGFRTLLIEDACRGVSVDSIERTKRNILDKHGVVVKSSQVQALVLAKDRPFELGYFAALQLKDKH